MEDKPRRIQRKRTRGWKMPPNTVYVGRPTMWGNPYKINQTVEQFGKEVVLKTREDVVRHYKIQAESDIRYQLRAQVELHGKNLACWCREGESCHADVLLRIANP